MDQAGAKITEDLSSGCEWIKKNCESLTGADEYLLILGNEAWNALYANKALQEQLDNRNLNAGALNLNNKNFNDMVTRLTSESPKRGSILGGATYKGAINAGSSILHILIYSKYYDKHAANVFTPTSWIQGEKAIILPYDFSDRNYKFHHGSITRLQQTSQDGQPTNIQFTSNTGSEFFNYIDLNPAKTSVDHIVKSRFIPHGYPDTAFTLDVIDKVV